MRSVAPPGLVAWALSTWGVLGGVSLSTQTSCELEALLLLVRDNTRAERA